MLLLAVLALARLGEGAAPSDPYVIERISVSPTATGASLLIETTGPVAFVTTSAPDPLTVLVELWKTAAPNGVERTMRDRLRNHHPLCSRDHP